MGYQESFVTCDDFDWLVDKVNQLGKNFFEEKCIEIVEIVTLNQDLEFDLTEQCHPEETVFYPKGTQFLWIVGDRGHQRISGYYTLLDEDSYDDSFKIFFIECFSNKLFSGGKRNFSWRNFRYNNETLNAV